MKKITFSIPWPLSPKDTREVLGFAFQVFLVMYVGLYVLESVNPGFVTLFVTLPHLLWVIIGIGILATVWPAIVPAAQTTTPRSLPGSALAWMILLGVITMLTVWYRAHSIGWPILIFSPLSGMLVFGLCFLVYFDRDESQPISS
jgi:hypothetical protein